jgi:hypothetical protein
VNITEKKLKEILLTVMNNKRDNVYIEFFYKFFNNLEEEVSFSSDDLSLFYKFNKLMVTG